MADGDRNKDIIFRRIRGRIVPIRVNRSRSSSSDSARKKAAGVALASSAFGAAAVGGAVQRKFQAKARDFRVRAFRARGLAERVSTSPSGRRTAATSFLTDRTRLEALLKVNRRAKSKSKQFLRAAKRSRIATIGAAGALLGAGLEQLVGDKQRTPEGRAAADFATNIVGTALAGAFILGRRKISITALKRAFGAKAKPKIELFKPVEF